MATLIDLEVPAVNTTILTASIATQYEIKGLWVHNTGDDEIVFSLFINRSESEGLKRKLKSTLSGGETLLIDFPSSFSLDNTDSLVGVCSTGGVNLTVLGDRTNRR